jgi:hypothetical protein
MCRLRVVTSSFTPLVGKRAISTVSFTMATTQLTSTNLFVSSTEAYHLPRATVVQKWWRKTLVWWHGVTCGACGISPDDMSDLCAEDELHRAVSKMRLAGYATASDQLRRTVRVMRAEELLATSSLGPFDPAESALVRDYFPLPQFPPVPVARAGYMRKHVTTRGYVQAKAVAAVVAVVDSKVGVTLDDTYDNHLLVDRVARQVMTTVGFRSTDISTHLPHIVECYFMCRQQLARAGGTRRRMPKWALAYMGFRRATTRRKT